MENQAKKRGFTLVEMMVTVAVLAIVVAIAFPSGRDFIANRRTSSQAREIYNTLQEARMLAIKEGRSVTISFWEDGDTQTAGATDKNRQQFMLIRRAWDQDGDNSVAADEQEDVVEIEERAYIDCNTNKAEIFFSSRGTATGASVRVLRKDTGEVERIYKVVVNSLGVVRQEAEALPSE